MQRLASICLQNLSRLQTVIQICLKQMKNVVPLTFVKHNIILRLTQNSCLPDMRIVHVGSSGKILGSFRFFKMLCANWPFGGYFLSVFYRFDCTNETKSWGKPQIKTTYMRKYSRDSLKCFASHLIKPKWGRSDNCAVTNLSGSSILWFLRPACRAWHYSHVCCLHVQKTSTLTEP